MNALECMIWAVLRANERANEGAHLLLASHYPHYHTDGENTANNAASPNTPALPGMLDSVDPARVARFLFPGVKRVEKRDKVALVRGWVGTKRASGFDIGFHEDVAEIVGSFGEAGNGVRNGGGKNARSGVSTTSKGSRNGGDKAGKMDDLADALIQGVTWCTWQSRRRRIGELSEQQIVDLALTLSESEASPSGSTNGKKPP